MDIKFNCNFCGKEILSLDKYKGLEVTCPHCNNRVFVPDLKPMKCPNCGLENPPEAQRCDCGYDFTTKKMEKSPLIGGHNTHFGFGGGVLKDYLL